jgi:hypothetical protein
MNWRIVPRSFGKATLYIECEHGGVDHGRGVRECARSLWQQPASGCMWQWDGNVERPFITPSINCQGGCGRHFTMKAGEPT